MAAYKDLVGQKITVVTSNPPEPKTGQMWYNSTDGVLRGLGVTTAWVTGGTYLDKVFGVALGGPVSAAIGAGGYGPPGPSSQNRAAEYDGSGWTTISNINTARGSLGSSKQGTQTAFWVAGGSSQTGKTEEWNGSSWSEDGDLNTGRRLSGTAGSLTAGLAFGGYASPAGTANSEEYNGTSWSEGDNLGASIYYNTGFGSQTAAISACGNTGSPDTGVNNSYQYDGTSWTSLPNVSYSQQQGGSHGNTSEGFVYGGSGSPSTYQNTTSEWSGTAWSTIPQTLPSPARAWNGSGPGTSGLQLGGSSPALPGGTTNTNEFTRNTNVVTAATWSAGANFPTASSQVSGAGPRDAAIGIGGYPEGSPPTNKSYEYNGVAWSAEATLNPNTGTSGVEATAGTQTACINAQNTAGGPPYQYIAAGEYDGSSWSNANNRPSGSYANAAAGTLTAGLFFGGATSPSVQLNTTLSYDGTNWTAEESLSTARRGMGGSGIQTAALGTAGYTNPPATFLTNTEEYGGESWTNGGALLVATRDGRASGTQTDSIYFGGGTPTKVTSTFGYDGTSWSTKPSLATARSLFGSGATSPVGAAWGAAGYYPGSSPNRTNTTEHFTEESTTGNITDFSTE